MNAGKKHVGGPGTRYRAHLRVRVLARRAGLAALLSVPLCVLVAPPASADCVGFGSETERVAAAQDRAAVTALGTPTSMQTYSRPPSGGVPITVYTFVVDTGIKGATAGDSIKIAAPQDNSIARTFDIGRRYFLAPSSSDKSFETGVDLASLAPYVDNQCSPTAPVDELSADFTNQWPTSSTISPTSSAAPVTTEGAMVDDGTTGDDGAGPILLGVVAALVVVGGGAFVLVRRLRR